jgi:hypothetical protein
MQEQLKEIQEKLIKALRSWALGRGFNPSEARNLRHKAILFNHRHYMDSISVYRRIAAEEGCGRDSDVQTIKARLMLHADIFKSYDQTWLDNADYNKMNQWLSGIFHKAVNVDMTGVKTIDEWIEALDRAGIYVTYSSGTSGAFSFVPRDKEEWELSRIANMAYLAPLLAHHIVGRNYSHSFVQSATRLLPIDRLGKTTVKKALSNYDAAFLGFKGGRMGNQALIQEMAPLFNNCCFLYEMEISGTALRSLRRGARTDDERRIVKSLQDKMLGQSKENYLRLIDNIEKSIKTGQRVFIFGAPYQFKELCELSAATNRKIMLKEGSLVVIGGGWKSFTGEAIGHDALIDMLSKTLHIQPDMILEGYSMTETSALTLRCKYGRFHIPPIIEPVIFDDALNPLEGDDLKGAFGFMDTLATSHPGFIISNDYIHMVNSDCECGLHGPAILEIGRLPGSEVKGCGGIMGSFSA